MGNVVMEKVGRSIKPMRFTSVESLCPGTRLGNARKCMYFQKQAGFIVGNASVVCVAFEWT